MIEIPLRHHVYSSLRGYRTLYASPDLDGETRMLLDTLAGKCRTAGAGGPVSGYFDLTGRSCCAVRGFEHGVDHVGRPRLCIHSLIFRDEDLARIPFFSPAALPPSLFANDGMDLQYISQQLPGAWRLEEPPASTAAARLRGLPDAETVRLFLAVLLAEGRVTYVVDGEQAAHIFESVSALLPPSRRRQLSFLRSRRVPEGGLPTPCDLHLVAEAPAEAEDDPEIFLVDLRRRITSRNLPPVGRYAQFVIQQYYEQKNPAAVAALCAMAERYCRGVEFNEYRLGQLVDAFQQAGGAIDPNGEARPDMDAPASARAAVSFARAGCSWLSLQLLKGAAGLLAPGDQVAAARIQKLEQMQPGPMWEAGVAEVADGLNFSNPRDPLDDTTLLF